MGTDRLRGTPRALTVRPYGRVSVQRPTSHVHVVTQLVGSPQSTPPSVAVHAGVSQVTVQVGLSQSSSHSAV